MERTVLIPMAALLVQAITQASPSPQLTEADAATASLRTTAANPGSYERRLGASGFEENKGQVKQTDGQPAPYVKFRLNDGGTNIFLLERGIAYQFNRMHDPAGYAELAHRGHLSSEDEERLEELRKKRRLETYRMDMILEGADPQPLITTEGRSNDWTNYYLSGVEALDVRTFSKVVYHEVYPGIDWEIMTTDKGFEHDFIVHPGGDPSVIKMRFTGQEELYLDEKGRLVHGNRLGRFVEEGPVSYQAEKIVVTGFNLLKDLLTFELPGYDESQSLRIDPVRLWGRYLGGVEAPGESSEGLNGVVVDPIGNVYCAGWSSSGSDIATVGSHDVTFAGQGDGIALKFDAEGIRQWGTYFGGSNDDYFSACAVLDKHLIAVGQTKTANGLAVTTHQTLYGGIADGLIVDFDTADGTLSWSTYYGGLQEDRINSCAVHGSGVLYVCGNTTSASPFDAIASEPGPDVYQQSPNFGGQQGFLAKFDTTGLRDWGTYLGNDNWTEAWGVATAEDGDVYISGGAGNFTNTNFQYSIATPDAHQSFSRGPDAYIVKFTPAGNRVWGTFYGGDASDWGWACATGTDGSVFLAGDTYSSTPEFAIDTLGHQSDYGGGGEEDAFLVKFDGDGIRQWGTYYGTAANDVARGCATDETGNAYIIGNTTSVSGISFEGHQNTIGGGEDGYLARFNANGLRTWGTYYGGDTLDNAQTAAVDGSGNIYMCGRTFSSIGIGSPSGPDDVRTGLQDGFLVKFGDYTDCYGVLNGPAIVGSSCDDGEPCTFNDVLNDTCGCYGTSVQIAVDINGNSIVGDQFWYAYSTSVIVPGATYAWTLPSGWNAQNGDVSSPVLIAHPASGGASGELCVSVSDADGCELASSCISIQVVDVAEVGLNDDVATDGVSIQPNPNNGRFVLVRSTAASGVMRYEILDALGRSMVLAGSITGPSTTIDMSGASAGMYFLRLQDESATGVMRMAVQY